MQQDGMKQILQNIAFKYYTQMREINNLYQKKPYTNLINDPSYSNTKFNFIFAAAVPKNTHWYAIYSLCLFFCFYITFKI